MAGLIDEIDYHEESEKLMLGPSWSSVLESVLIAACSFVTLPAGTLAITFDHAELIMPGVVPHPNLASKRQCHSYYSVRLFYVKDFLVQFSLAIKLYGR